MANTGAPLDAAGVAALASLRASAKRDRPDTVGRFGVGFAAVLALCDAPRVVSVAGGVRFSAADTAAAVAELAGPAAELALRDGQVPVLRLVWPVEDDEPPVPAGCSTEVRLRLRAGLDPAALLAAARAAAPDLLLALPDLVEITVGTERHVRTHLTPDGAVRTVAIEGGGPARRWLLSTRAGRLDEQDAAGLAVEQRARRDWTVTWALPLAADGRPAPLTGDVLHAPTGTAERLALPARLIASLPLEPDRRRVRPGPVTDRVLAEVGACYLDLVRAVAPVDRLALVPPPGFPRSELDGRLRDAVLDTLRTAAWLPAAAPRRPSGRAADAERRHGGRADVPGRELAPSRAEWLDVPGAADLPALLAEDEGAFPGLLAAAAAPPPGDLGVRRLGPAELAGRLLGRARPAAWWRAVYAALEPAVEAVPGLRDELRALPVPLADGRTVAGPAGALLPAGGGTGLPELALPGLHLVDPDAAHPLLARLGAATADAAALLDHPALRDAVERSVDDAEAGLDPTPLAAAVLDLLTELGPGAAAARPWLAALALPAADGTPARADELLLPRAALGPLLAPDAGLDELDATLAARAPRDVLAALGVLDGFAVLVDADATGPDHDLDDEEAWWTAAAPDPAEPVHLVAVRDLDLVADDAWPAALALLAGDPATRAALLDRATRPSYTAWWLSRHARLGGRPPGHWRLRSAAALAALYDPVDVDVDEAVLAAVGVRADLAVRDAAEAADLLARLGDPARHPDAALVTDAHAALASAVATGRVDVADLEPPRRVRALDGTVADADDAVVLDGPWYAAVLPPGEVVAGGQPVALADLLDLPLASETVAADVEGVGRPVPWAALPEVVVACRTLGIAVPAGEVRLHDELRVAVRSPHPGRRTAPSWRDDEGRWHAADPVRALVAALGAPGGDGAVVE